MTTTTTRDALVPLAEIEEAISEGTPMAAVPGWAAGEPVIFDWRGRPCVSEATARRIVERERAYRERHGRLNREYPVYLADRAKRREAAGYEAYARAEAAYAQAHGGIHGGADAFDAARKAARKAHQDFDLQKPELSVEEFARSRGLAS